MERRSTASICLIAHAILAYVEDWQCWFDAYRKHNESALPVLEGSFRPKTNSKNKRFSACC
jgi:hypothetical protein